MAGMPDRGEQRYIPEFERGEWRARFFSHIRVSPRHKAIVAQDLQDIHRKGVQELRRTLTEESDSVPVESWQLAADFRCILVDVLYFPELQVALPIAEEYVAEVEKTATKTLRLAENGHPPMWVCDLIHQDVNPLPDTFAWAESHRTATAVGMTISRADHLLTENRHSLTPEDEAIARQLQIIPNRVLTLTIQVTVGTQGASIIVDDVPSIADRSIPASGGIPFSDWRDLEEAGHEVMKTVVSDLSRQWAGYFPLRRRPQALRRREETCRRFAAYVLKEFKPHARDEEQRLREFAQLIGVDFPRIEHRRINREKAA